MIFIGISRSAFIIHQIIIPTTVGTYKAISTCQLLRVAGFKYPCMNFGTYKCRLAFKLGTAYLALAEVIIKRIKLGSKLSVDAVKIIGYRVNRWPFLPVGMVRIAQR